MVQHFQLAAPAHRVTTTTRETTAMDTMQEPVSLVSELPDVPYHQQRTDRSMKRNRIGETSI